MFERVLQQRMAVMWIVDSRVRKMVVVEHMGHRYDEIFPPFITEVTQQVAMALRSERAMVRLRPK